MPDTIHLCQAFFSQIIPNLVINVSLLVHLSSTSSCIPHTYYNKEGSIYKGNDCYCCR